MGILRSLCVLGLVVGCSHHHGGDDTDANGTPGDACDGLQCFIVDCASKGLPPTSVSGTVFAPNGTLPLYNVNVYVPLTDPGPLKDGVTCDRCDAGLPGTPIALAQTDEAGHFVLDDVPATANVPLVIQIGKWRRRLTLPNVAACQDTALPAVQTTLPKNRSEGDVPAIAITTGSADALECLIRKLGVDDAEITTDTQGGRVHLYSGNGANQFKAGFAGGTGMFSDAQMLWGNLDRLKTYDIVIFSCEGAQRPATKPQAAMQAVHDYAGIGGRVFMSHWHNIWIGGEQNNPSHGLADWESTATFNFNAPQDQDTTIASVDESVPKGVSFATWLMNVGASTTRDQVPISGARYTCPANNVAMSDRRVFLDTSIPAVNNHHSVQDLEFTTPVTVDPSQRCGKVVFSDMHVSSGSSSSAGTPYPNGCATGDLTPQEKALAFIFFDISSCVGAIF